MNQVWGSKVPLYFETEESQLVLGDSFKILTKMKQESVDMIFADPPYFLSNDGITCQGGKMVSVNKGSWDKLSESGTSVEEKDISLTESGLGYVRKYSSRMAQYGYQEHYTIFIRLVWHWSKKASR